MVKRSVKNTILIAAAAACLAATAAYGETALPNEDTSMGAMHFKAPDQYSSVRRMTSFDVSGTVTDKRLVFTLDDAWWLTLEANPVSASYDMKEDVKGYFPEEAVTEAEVDGQSALICDDGDELYVFIRYEDFLYAVDYEEEAADTADRTFLDGFLSGVQFSGTWEESPVNDDSLGSMGYTTPELAFKEKTISVRADQEGVLLDKYILYSFESRWDRLFLRWYPGQTLTDYLSEEKLASAKELEIAGIKSCFVPYDEEKYEDSLGYYYIGQEDGLYEIISMFDPVTDQKEEMLGRLLDSVNFSDPAQVIVGEVQEIIRETEEEEAEEPAAGENTDGSEGTEAAEADETSAGTETEASEGTLTEQVLAALDNSMYSQAYAAFAQGLVIEPGYSGEAGIWLQTTLNALGADLQTDGAAGEMTFGKLHFYQDIFGMEQTDYVDASVYEKLLPALLIAADVSRADEILRGAGLEGMLDYEDLRARIVSLQ